MRSMVHPYRLAQILLLLEIPWLLGPGCGGSAAPPNYASITACGLLASECVPLDGSSPIALLAGDLNGNGNPDLVVANFSRDNLSTLLNDGFAFFEVGANYPVGESPLSIAGGDWDKDGDIDLVVSAGFGLSLLFNQGNATFNPAERVYLGAPPWSVVAADLNGDDNVDLATVNGIGDELWILVNNGAGEFDVQIILHEDPDLNFSEIAAGDINDDGNIDLVATQDYDRILLFLNDGSGAFETPDVLVVGNTRALLTPTVQDLNGDGHGDLIVTNGSDSENADDPGRVFVFLNQGNGTFDSGTELTAGSYPLSVATADYDQDGQMDIAVANNLSDDVSLFFNLGGGMFASARSIPVGNGPAFVIAEDLDGDGVSDLAVANMNSDSISILLNDGTGQFIPENE